MKIAIASGLAFGLVAAQPALAQSAGSNPTGLYLGAAIGLDYYYYYGDDDADGGDDDADGNDDFDDGGGSLALQLGYRFTDNWRTELEAGATIVDFNTGEDDDVFGLLRVTAGLYYDFLSSDNLPVPYAGGAIGIADVDQVDTEFTWHAEAGLSVNVNGHFAIVPAYRYTWVDDSNNVTTDNLDGHAFRLGARISF